MNWVRKNVLHMTEDDILQIQREVELERENEDEMIPYASDQNEEIEPTNPIEITDNTQSKVLSSEEKGLVESMTRFYNSLSSEYEED